MFVKQLSIFIENKAGRLNEVLMTVSGNGINIVSASLADTNDFGVLRLLVSDPDKAHKVLKEKGITSKLTDVIAVSIPHAIGSLRDVIFAINEAGVNIQYIYGLSLNGEGASIAMKTDDMEKTVEVIDSMGVKMFTQEEL